MEIVRKSHNHEMEQQIAKIKQEKKDVSQAYDGVVQEFQTL